jgi:hypothetical protein
MENDGKSSCIISLIKGRPAADRNTVLLLGHVPHPPSVPGPDARAEGRREEKATYTHIFCGLAGQLYLMDHYAARAGEFPGNLCTVLYCGGTDRPERFLDIISSLHELKKKFGLEYAGAIHMDFDLPFGEGDHSRRVYTGTAGSLVPSFFIVGARKSLPVLYELLDPHFIAAHLIRQIHGNPTLTAVPDGEISFPPRILRYYPFEQTPDEPVKMALVQFQMYPGSRKPEDVLYQLKKEATVAARQALTDLEKRHRRFCRIAGIPYKGDPLFMQILTFEELNDDLENKYGFQYIREIRKRKGKPHAPGTDPTHCLVQIMKEVWKWADRPHPAILLGFSPYYFPAYTLTGKNRKEKILMKALTAAITEVQPFCPEPIQIRHFYPNTSLMNYFALSGADDEDGFETVIHNQPGWGTDHYVDMEKVRDLDVPIIHIGPCTEFKGVEKKRDVDYSYEILPNLIKSVIDHLLECSSEWK